MSNQIFEFASVSAVGERENQEDMADSVLLAPDKLLCVLADGMGGQAGGEVASRAAVEAFTAIAVARSSDSPEELLELGLVLACAAVETRAQKDARLRDMGTTLTAVLFDVEDGAPVLRWISIGDSPLYRIDARGVIERLNADQSLAGELEAEVRAGLVSPDQALGDPRRSQSNILTEVITRGGSGLAEADFRREPLRLEQGDLVLLASDGIETLTEDTIAKLIAPMRSHTVAEIADALLDAVLARRAPWQDNVTFTLVRPISASPR